MSYIWQNGEVITNDKLNHSNDVVMYSIQEIIEKAENDEDFMSELITFLKQGKTIFLIDINQTNETESVYGYNGLNLYRLKQLSTIGSGGPYVHFNSSLQDLQVITGSLYGNVYEVLLSFYDDLPKIQRIYKRLTIFNFSNSTKQTDAWQLIWPIDQDINAK